MFWVLRTACGREIRGGGGRGMREGLGGFKKRLFAGRCRRLEKTESGGYKMVGGPLRADHRGGGGGDGGATSRFPYARRTPPHPPPLRAGLGTNGGRVWLVVMAAPRAPGEITSQRLLDQSQAGIYRGKRHIPPHFGPFWAHSRTLPQGVELLV